MLTKIIWSLRKDDGDGNENGKKAIGLDKQNNNSARASRYFFIPFDAVIRDLFEEKIGKSRVWKTIMFSLLNEDPHGTFFCTPQDAGIVKDAKVWVTSNKPPTVKKQLVSLQFGPLWIGPSIQSSVSEKKSDKRHLITTNFMNIN